MSLSILINVVCLVVLCLTIYRADLYKKEKSSKRVCVIGAGIAGLTTARYLKEEGIYFTVLEATRYVGGTWRYEPRVKTDENGQPLYTSMYKHLRTNIPNPAMELPGFSLPDSLPSFPTGEMFHNYLKGYAQHFDLYKHIQFLHSVVLVTRKNNVWRVKHKHVQTLEVFEEEYDYVVVGTGHFSKPNMPDIPGENKFKGTIIHSHDYREPEPYRGRRVLVIGSGPSGMDIGIDVAEVSRTLIHSHHTPQHFKTKYPPHYVIKPDVKELNETGALFVDGSFEELDDIIYCTGFEYYYPFLDETSGLTITPQYVTPLYKYLVNINQPTMVVMGLVVRACVVIALDAQARYTIALIKGNFTLPSRELMMQDWQKHVNAVKSKGLPPSYLHILGDKEDQYYAGLSEESGIARVPPVLYKIRATDIEAKLENLYTYRNYVYTIVDDHTFTRKLEESQVGNGLSP